MAQRNRTKISGSRRLISGAGALGIVAGTIAITGALGAPAAHAATSKALKFNCSATVFGTVMDQGVWTATVSSNLPAQVEPGATLPAPSITAKVTSSTSATDTLRSLGITSVDGTSKAGYTVKGAVENAGSRTADLSIPSSDVPKSGGLKTTASGTGASETAVSDPGTITVEVGNFTANIQTYQGKNKSLVIPVTCKLQSGQNATLGTISVGAPPTSPSSSPSSSTSSSPSSSTSASPTSSSTSASPTGTSTGTATATSTTTGPPIVTDGGSTGSGPNASILGGAAVAAAGVGVLGYGLRRRVTAEK